MFLFCCLPHHLLTPSLPFSMSYKNFPPAPFPNYLPFCIAMIEKVSFYLAVKIKTVTNMTVMSKKTREYFNKNDTDADLHLLPAQHMLDAQQLNKV